MTSFRLLVERVAATRPASTAASVPTHSSPIVPPAPGPVLPTHRFDAPQQCLVPTLPNIISSRGPIYVETNNFALSEQQRIINWENRSAYVFTNAFTYLSLIQLYTTSTRPFQFNDNILFLQPDQHPFTPADPWGTLFLQRQLLYRIVRLNNDVLHCDFVELFFAPTNAQLSESDIVIHMSCRYIGTYLLRVNVDSASQTSSASGLIPRVPGSTQLSSPV